MDGYKLPEDKTISKDIKPLEQTVSKSINKDAQTISKDNKTQQENAKIMAETIAAVVVSRTLTEAAALLKIHRITLWDRIKKYELQPIIDEFTLQAFTALRMASVNAAEEFADQLKHSNVHIRTEAAREILDRVGVKQAPVPQNPVQINNNIIMPKEMSEEEAAALVNGRT